MPGQSAQEAMGPPAKPGLKDPLQAEQTAYEILGLGRGANDSDVQKAFAMGLARRVNVQKLTSAKRILQSPTERAALDLFHYIPDWAGRLSPNPVQQPLILDLARRGSTAQAWENQMRSAFPDIAVAHSLAVLWYWWAVHEEDRLNGSGKAASAIPLEQMWRKTIAAWAMVLSNEEFWQVALGVSSDSGSQVSAAIIGRMNSRFQEVAQRHRSNNSAGQVARYQELELALATELRTARQIGAAGIRTARGKVICGVLMLQQVELLETVRKQVEAGLQKSPSSENLKKLQTGLSRYASIVMLIDSNKPQAALDALDALPRTEKDAPEAKSIRAQALHALAQQCVSLKDLDRALARWEDALRLQPNTDLRSAIFSAVVAGCQSQAAALQHHEPDAAITLLERALKSVDDPKIKLLLADLLTNRAIRRINDAQNKANANGPLPSAEIESELKKGLADLDRATKLGSKRAADQLETARKLCDEFASGSVLREAHAAAEREDWDGAIRLLRTALSSLTGESATTVKKNLAVCLANRAMDTANRALQRPNPAIAKRDEMFAQISLMASLGSGCALCYSTYGSSWYSVNLPEGGTARLCGDCASKLQTVINDAGKPDPTTQSALRSAEKDLAEAVDLDQSNQHARQNLQDLRKILSQVAGGATFSSGSSATPSRSPSAASRRTSHGRTDVGRSKEPSRAGQIASEFFSLVGKLLIVILFCLYNIGNGSQTERMYAWVALLAVLTFCLVVAIRRN